MLAYMGVPNNRHMHFGNMGAASWAYSGLRVQMNGYAYWEH